MRQIQLDLSKYVKNYKPEYPSCIFGLKTVIKRPEIITFALLRYKAIVGALKQGVLRKKIVPTDDCIGSIKSSTYGKNDGIFVCSFYSGAGKSRIISPRAPKPIKI